MAYVPIMVAVNTNSSCDVPLALFDKVSLTLIISLIIVALILILFDDGFNLFKWAMGCFGASALVCFVWMIHGIWF